MERISVDQLQPDQIFDKCLAFDNHIIILMPGLKLSEEDINSFKNWKITSLLLVEKEKIIADLTEDVSTEFASKKAAYVHLIQEAVDVLKRFYKDVEYRGMTSFLVIKNLARECLFMLKKNSEFVSLYMHAYLPKTSEFESDALKVAIYSLIIGIELKLDDKKLLILFECAVLINIGLLKMKPLLKKSTKLEDKEKQLLQRHPIIGFNIIKNKMKLNDLYALVTLTHQERIDGSGHPRHLTGDKLPLYSKIIAVAKQYVALSVIKPYRRDFSLYDAMQLLISDGGKKLDQMVLNCLLTRLSLYPIGSIVLLNNLKIGIVFSVNKRSPLLPKVLLVLDEGGQKLLTSKQLIDLSNQKGIVIKKAITDADITSSAYNCL